MNEVFSKWDTADQLNDVEDARLYLESCAMEDPGDGSLICAALTDIARSGNMTWLARETGMSRDSLYKELSEDGDPALSTVIHIVRALGLQVRFTA